jgi:hypothetical protein
VQSEDSEAGISVVQGSKIRRTMLSWRFDLERQRIAKLAPKGARLGAAHP